MKPIEFFLKPTQRKLYDMLRKMYKGKTVCCKHCFVLVRGEAPIMLVAHLDTVHKEPVSDICTTADGDILMSPQGIGGDDRCGVYALVRAYEAAEKKPWLLFTCDEEIGGRGADAFCQLHEKGKLPKELAELKCLVEIDRRGSEDAVYYDCDNKDFEAYITSKRFVTAYGSFSDISYVAPELGVAAVNLSSGYYNAHTQHEYISRKQLEAVIEKVKTIVADAAQPDFPKYEYVERKRVYLTRWFETDWYGQSMKLAGDKKNEETLKVKIPANLPVKYQQMYDELLDVYEADELEYYRENYGDGIIADLYADEIGADVEDLR